MLWIPVFFLLVWIFFKPLRSSSRIAEDSKEGYENKEGINRIQGLNKVQGLNKIQGSNIDNSEHYQRSIYDRDISKLSQYYENPKLSCPYKYEEAQDVLTKLKSDPKNQYYGFTGTNFKYEDDRHVKWEKLSQPLPVHADFFQS